MHEKAKFFIVAFALLLISLSVVQAEGILFDDVEFYKTNKTRPEIHVEYDSRDAPIDIIDYSMVNSQGVTVPLQYSADEMVREFNFTIKEKGSLFGKYVFQIVAKDKDGNTNIDYQGIEVESNPMNIWVERPANMDVEHPQDQHFAVEKKTPFNLVLRSESAAKCRILKNNGLLEGKTNEQLFNSGKRFNNASGAFTTQHEIPVFSAKQQSSSTTLNVFEFDNANYEAENQYLVICKDYKVGSQEPDFKQQIFHIGYDLTPPEFNISYHPSEIFDEASLKTKANIQSKEDLLVCSYEFVNNTEPEYQPESYDLSPNTRTIEDYKETINTTFDFSDKGTYHFDRSYPYKVKFNCSNPAGQTTSKTRSFDIRLRLAFDILYDDTGYYSTSDPTLQFTTRKIASCRYKFQSDDYEKTEENDYSHNVTLSNIEEGNYSIALRCDSLGGEREEKTFEFTIDKTEPEAPQILSDEYNCQDRWTITLDTPSEAVYYNISLHNQTRITNNSLQYHLTTPSTSSMNVYQASPDIPVVKNETYMWTIKAIDRAGLESTTTTHEIRGAEQDDIVCDTDYPTATVESEQVSEGFDVTLSCEDRQSGCTPLYGYAELMPSQNCSDVSYTMRSYNDTQTISPETLFCYQVQDKAGHRTNGSKLFTTDINITIEKPWLGMAQSTLFDLEATTDRPAQCRQGPTVPDHPKNESEWYESLDNFTNGISSVHTTTFSAEEYAQLDEDAQEDQANWTIICKESKKAYHTKQFVLGFDMTPAQLTLIANPNPIVNPEKQTTTLELTADNPVVCTFLDIEGVPRGFEGYDPENKKSYRQSFEETIDYWGVQDEILQQVKCRNIAGHISEAKTTVEIEPENDLEIDIKTDQFQSSKRFNLEATTQEPAECSYKTSKDDKLSSMQITGETDHSTFLSLDQGEHTIEVNCQAGEDKSLAYKTITVDTQKPTLSILAAEETCSLSEIQFSLIGNGTGSPIEQYEYMIEGSDIPHIHSVSTTNPIKQNISMQQGNTYNIQATATDKAGNSRAANVTVTATSDDWTMCDRTPPSGEAKISYDWKHNEVDIICNDDLSGCADHFTFQKTRTACDDKYHSMLYEQLPVSIYETTTICYELYDNAGNVYRNSLNVSVPLQCFNGIEDPDEKGVDCEGPCPAMCGTCDNGKQDPFEMGLDCGGVCSSVSKCETDTEPESECETDQECPVGERCSATGDCVPEREEENKQQETGFDNSPDMLGLILLISGFVLVLGGAGYIAYSRYEKYQQRQQQRQVMNQQMRQRQQQEQIRKQQQERKQRMEEIKTRQQQQNNTREQKVKERKKYRKSLIGAFENSALARGKDTTNKSEEQHDRTAKYEYGKQEEQAKNNTMPLSQEDENERQLEENTIEEHENEQASKTIQEQKNDTSTQQATEEFKRIQQAQSRKSLSGQNNIFDELESLEKQSSEQQPRDQSSVRFSQQIHNSQALSSQETSGQINRTHQQGSALDDLDNIIHEDSSLLSDEFDKVISHQSEDKKIRSATSFIKDKAEQNKLEEQDVFKLLDTISDEYSISREDKLKIVSRLRKQRILDAYTKDGEKS